jgi:FixJ family two-component response regulator
MGGIELQAVLRARGCAVPFVFITAFPEEVVRMQAVDGGATGFLTKPFDAPTLIKYVEAALTSKPKYRVTEPMSQEKQPP